jgi:hypothetical protein
VAASASAGSHCGTAFVVALPDRWAHQQDYPNEMKISFFPTWFQKKFQNNTYISLKFMTIRKKINSL